MKKVVVKHTHTDRMQCNMTHEERPFQNNTRRKLQTQTTTGFITDGAAAVLAVRVTAPVIYRLETASESGRAAILLLFL